MYAVCARKNLIEAKAKFAERQAANNVYTSGEDGSSGCGSYAEFGLFFVKCPTVEERGHETNTCGN